MEYTNAFNLPAPLVSAVKRDAYDRVGNISVTALIKSPRMRVLEQRHDAEITEDVADCIWRLIGSIGHKILERADTDNHLSEERITTKLLGWTISGKADLLAPDMTLDDYKFTSVFAVALEDKAEWEAQINLYAWLYRQNGFEVRRARIIAVLRDWSKTRAAREPDYPQVGVIVKEIPLWFPGDQQRFAEARVKVHQDAEALSDDALPPCSDVETWKKADTWAVKKVGNKRATAVFKTEAEAIARRGGAPQLVIEHRPGSYPRCAHYCASAAFCNQWQQNKPAASVEIEEATA